MKKNKEFNAIMEGTMGQLNLKPHLCGANKSNAKVLCSAADIEGHLGIDQKVAEEIINIVRLSSPT